MTQPSMETLDGQPPESRAGQINPAHAINDLIHGFHSIRVEKHLQSLSDYARLLYLNSQKSMQIDSLWIKNTGRRYEPYIISKHIGELAIEVVPVYIPRNVNDPYMTIKNTNLGERERLYGIDEIARNRFARRVIKTMDWELKLSAGLDFFVGFDHTSV